MCSYYDEKEERIWQCLNDDSESEIVNLWQLREEALTPGGLLSSSIRKSAWPKLLACHEQVWKNHHFLVLEEDQPNSGRISIADPKRLDILSLQQDVARTLWRIQEHMEASKREQERKNQHLKGHNKKQVSFASPIAVVQKMQGRALFPSNSCSTGTTSMGTLQEVSAPPCPEIIATSSSEDEDDTASEMKGATSNITTSEPVSTPFLSESAVTSTFLLQHPECDNDTVDLSIQSQETSFSATSRVIRWRRASRQEQKILFNVILSVIRSIPPNSASPNQYYTGLQDLAAILVINLESPSLTSLVLTKLSHYHLYRSFQNPEDPCHFAKAVFPLLEAVDPTLHNFLHSAGLSLALFSRQWISCWFAQDVPDVFTASRLLDVLIVSHPLMPVYLTVALLQTHRRRLLNCDPSPTILYSILRGLAAAASREEMEDVIQLALKGMKQLPPDNLAQRVENLSSISNLVPPAPVWKTMDTAPTDYAALRVRPTGQEQPAPSHPRRNNRSLHLDYPLAAVACGIKTRRFSPSILFILLAVFLWIVATLWLPNEVSVGSPGVEFLPSVSRKFHSRIDNRVMLALPETPSIHTVKTSETTRNALVVPVSASNMVAPSSKRMVWEIVWGRWKGPLRQMGKLWKSLWSKVRGKRN